MSLTKIVGPSLGVVEVTSLSGNGTPLTSLNASSLLSGTVPVARLSSANSSVGGIVDIVAQTFAGAKTFTSNATFSGSRTFFASGSVLDWNSGDVTLTHSANTLTFGGASSGYIFNDGNVGIGVTPSDSDIRHLQFGTNAIISGSGNSYLSNNAVFKGAWKYVASSIATMQYSMTSSGHQFDYAAAGTAGGSITFTTALGINTSGHLGIAAGKRFYFDGVAGTGDTYIYQESDNQITFVTNGTGRLYIDTATVGPRSDNNISSGSNVLRWSVVYATNGTIQTSDRTLKRNISTDTLGLDFVQKLRPVSFTMHDEADGARRHGLIAQEVIEAADGQSLLGILTGDKDGEYGLNYAGFVPALVAAIQQQQKEIDDLKLRLSKRDV